MKKREKATLMVRVTEENRRWLRIESVKRGITIDQFLHLLRKNKKAV